jgi:hypothetical protein
VLNAVPAPVEPSTFCALPGVLAPPGVSGVPKTHLKREAMVPIAYTARVESM